MFWPKKAVATALEPKLQWMLDLQIPVSGTLATLPLVVICMYIQIFIYIYIIYIYNYIIMTDYIEYALIFNPSRVDRKRNLEYLG